MVSVPHLWLSQRRGECTLFCIFRETQALPLFLLAVVLECEVQEESLAPGFRGTSYRLDVVHLPSSCPDSGHAGAGRTVHTQTVLQNLLGGRWAF